MKKKKLIACLACAFLLAAPAFLRASRNYRVVNGPDGFYYGHISYTEAKSDGKDPVIRREGETAMEAAVLNLPVGPGDTILTPADRRCEIQFDSGTILRLDVDTELRIETVNAQSLSSSARLSNLVLVRGRICAMYKQYDRREMFQILTPNTAVKLGHKTVAVIRAAGDGSTDIQVKFGKANAMFGRDDRSLKQGLVKKAERLIVLADYQFQRSAYVPDTAFDLWNDEINANFDKLHKGQSALPKPVQNLPGAVFYFAQNYGSMYGEWLWDDLYGYVWRPYRNQMQYPWGWAPYYYGRWSSYGGQMYWVAEEPWGWIPYHLGIWQWDAKLGWVWMPGSLFAPAWVSWEFFFGYCGWRPWGLYDWFDSFGTGFGYWDGGWSYGTLGPYEGAPLPGPPGRPFLYNVPKNKLQQTDALTTTVPKEIKSIKASVLAAYKRGDQRVLESVKQAAAHTVFVAERDLTASKVQEKALTWDKIPKAGITLPAKADVIILQQPTDTRKAAFNVFRGNQTAGPSAAQADEARAIRTGVRSAEAKTNSPTTAPAGTNKGGSIAATRTMERQRILDWNPDVKVAHRLGVRIEYSAGRNEIRCPELNLKSSDRLQGQAGFVPQMTSSGVSFVPSSAVGSGAPASAASSGPRSASAPTSRPTGGGEKKESSGGGGGKPKN